MQVKVLGCSGGIGDNLRTTSMLVDSDILIDAGTGVGDLSIEQLAAIDHIFVTHSHLDHITSIPFLLDRVSGMRTMPVNLYATAETIQILKDHIFNWKIWPDFNAIPDRAQPFLQYKEIKLGEAVVLKNPENNRLEPRRITALPANHVVPAVGYRVDSGETSLVFTGDTTSCESLWQAVNTFENLKYLIIETSFPNAEIELAKLSKHLCPSMLAHELSQLTLPAYVYITHLKPDASKIIMQEIQHSVINLTTNALQNGQVFEL